MQEIYFLEVIMKHFTIYDKILICTIALISISSMIFIPFLFLDSSSDKYIVVNISGNEIHRFHLVDKEELQLQEFSFVIDGIKYNAILEIRMEKQGLEGYLIILCLCLYTQIWDG